MTTLNNDDAALMAELYGNASLASSKKQDSKLGVLKLVQKAIMGEIEVAGKSIKTEVIPEGAYELYIQEQKVYCITPRIRIFGHKQLWTFWDGDNNKMHRSLLADDLKGSLKDTMGTFNLGRPAYIQDWKALPKSDQEFIRARRRTFLLQGVIDFDGACMDAGGKTLEGFEHTPFTMEIKNADSIEGLHNIIKKINLDHNCTKGNVIDIQLGSKQHDSSMGTFSTMIFSIPKGAVAETQAEFIGRERDTLKSFAAWNNMRNTYVKEQWSQNNKEELNDEETDLVSKLVDVEGAPV